ncbi:uncharacterized protein LOC128712693 [Anopheles marshallii]|uniref:uncharacterized protein LOC128712693 n=1 Tax=Anopheles marshallii TaxID=1521116 RepID=UPI00237A291B|nr:uncharacterized protein LOC128712693 [Anopheles marshallii]
MEAPSHTTCLVTDYLSPPSATSADATFQQYVELMFQFDAVFETLCLAQTNDSVEAGRMVEANQALQNCVNLHHDPQNFTNALDLLTVENRKDFISYNCDQFEEIKKCYHPFTRQLEICFTERDVSMIKTLIMLEEEFAYICERDGANVVSVQRSNYSYCAGNLQELLQNCSMPDWAELRSKTIDTMTERHCSIFETLATCFQTNITKCGAPLFAQLFNIRYQAIAKKMSCNKNLSN